MISIETFIMGALGIGIAVGLNLYRNRKENAERRRRDAFFVMQITENLRKMAQYFLDVETKTVRDEGQDESATRMVRSLGAFYHRNEQEMKDVLHQTKLYLPFWSNLPPEDKQAVSEVLDLFTWLLYDYYQEALPESLRERMVVQSRGAFFEKKARLMDSTHDLLSRYEMDRIAQQASPTLS